MHSSAALCTALGTGCWPSTSSFAGSRRQLGLQLFTVMTLLEKDFEGTLATIAEFGYREVETIGAFGRDPATVRAMLDAHGLESPSQHLVPGDLYSAFLRFTRRELSFDEVKGIWLRQMAIERIEPIIEEAIGRAQKLGQRYIVWQIIWPEQMQSREELDAFCRALDRAGELCAQAGLVFNFHNHSDEFAARDGYVPYDVILESTHPDRVKLELDFYWAAHGGVDPLEYLRRHPGRYVQCHLKDSTADGDFATVGQGVLDIPAYLEGARKAGIEHYYVEYDRSDDPLAVVRDAAKYLKPRI
jgi:sugar phosphate isomerase/epimerase